MKICFFLKVESINFNSKPCIVRDNDQLDGQKNQSESNLVDGGGGGVEEDKVSLITTDYEQPRFYLNEQRSDQVSSSDLLNGLSGEFETITTPTTTMTTNIIQQSPDSKRFKQGEDTDISSGGQVADDVVDVSTLSRLSEFNRSKKVCQI